MRCLAIVGARKAVAPAIRQGDAQKQMSQFPVRHCERSEAIQGPQYDRLGCWPPHTLWPLDCFVAKAPRNDGWAAADPIASVVIGRRLNTNFRLNDP